MVATTTSEDPHPFPTLHRGPPTSAAASSWFAQSMVGNCYLTILIAHMVDTCAFLRCPRTSTGLGGGGGGGGGGGANGSFHRVR